MQLPFKVATKSASSSLSLSLFLPSPPSLPPSLGWRGIINHHFQEEEKPVLWACDGVSVLVPNENFVNVCYYIRLLLQQPALSACPGRLHAAFFKLHSHIELLKFRGDTTFFLILSPSFFLSFSILASLEHPPIFNVYLFIKIKNLFIKTELFSFNGNFYIHRWNNLSYRNFFFFKEIFFLKIFILIFKRE